MQPTYFSYNALITQRASGFQNTQYALAELIDNSFDANATSIRVLCFEKRSPDGRESTEEIIVCDNGDGMNKEQLQTCLQFGDTAQTDIDEIVTQKKKGKFGFGLPNASLSQCRSISVYSWQSKDNVMMARLDLDELKDTKSIDIPPVVTKDLPPYYRDVKAVIAETHGTIVSWRNCDRLSHRKGETTCKNSENLLGSLYRYLLARHDVGVQLEVWKHNPAQNTYSRVQNVKLVPNDPLFLMENTVLAKDLYKEAHSINTLYADSYKKFSISEDKCLATNVPLKDKCFPFEFRWLGRTYKFEITTSVARIEIQKPGIKIGAQPLVGQFYGKRDSISFVRADREIASGTFSFYRKTEPQHRWWSIEVKFNGDADDLFGVHNNKQGIKFSYTEPEQGISEPYDELRATLPEAREEFWIQLTKHIDGAYKEAWKVVRKQGKEWDARHVKETPGQEIPPLPGATPGTLSAFGKTDPARPAKFTDAQRQLLFERLQEKYPSIPAPQIQTAIQRFDETKLRGCLLYHASEDQALWNMTEVFGFLVILVNTNHPFYENILAPLRNSRLQPALTAIELFLSSLAWEEMGTHFMQQERRDVLEEYRALVGIHLNRYIKENNIVLESFDFEVDAPGEREDE